MNSFNEDPTDAFPKALTGIGGFDEMTYGGLPRGNATLVTGGPGSGKTVFGLQMLANGVKLFKEPGIFVAFEETTGRLLANAASLGWSLAEAERQKLFFLDAMPAVDALTVGEFDLSGMLAVLSAKVQAIKARRIVFDSLDILLRLLPSVVERRREINRLHAWLRANELTAVITAKLDWSDKALPFEDEALQYLPFIVDCVVALTHEIEHDFSQRRVRVIKYRGSSFLENATAFIIGPRGLEVAAADKPLSSLPLATEKVTTGLLELDEMLYGGLMRGSTTMITGHPGTAKTTLAGAFAGAAAKRGERTVYVAFDEMGEEIVRNLSSVNVQLREYVESGILQMHSAYVGGGSAEQHLQRIKTLVERQRATCLVIDPFTVFSRRGSVASTEAVAARLTRWVKSQAITLVFTSLPLTDEQASSGALFKVTNVADTWIHLEMFNNGERNRGLTIIKSRGTNHSNQVRELLLMSTGLSIAPPFTADGKLLMGTLRWQKERTDREERARQGAEFERQNAAMDDEIAELDSHVKTLERNLAAKRRARTAMANTEQLRHKDEDLRHSGMIRLRQAGEVGSAEGTQAAATKKRRPRKAVAKGAGSSRSAGKGAANP